MKDPVTMLIEYLEGREEFHCSEMKLLNRMLKNIDPNGDFTNISQHHIHEILSLIDTLFQFNNIVAGYSQHINLLYQKLSKL